MRFVKSRMTVCALSAHFARVRRPPFRIIIAFRHRRRNTKILLLHSTVRSVWLFIEGFVAWSVELHNNHVGKYCSFVSNPFHNIIILECSKVIVNQDQKEKVDDGSRRSADRNSHFAAENKAIRFIHAISEKSSGGRCGCWRQKLEPVYRAIRAATQRRH